MVVGRKSQVTYRFKPQLWKTRLFRWKTIIFGGKLILIKTSFLTVATILTIISLREEASMSPATEAHLTNYPLVFPNPLAAHFRLFTPD